MRILLTTDTVGGVWTYALELSHALAAHDVRIALATMGQPLSPDQRDQLQRLSNVQLFESHFKLEWMEDPWDDLEKAGRWLLDIERQFGPDVIHCNGYCHAALPWRAPALVVAHSCVLSWWRAVKRSPAPPSWDRYRAEVKRGLRAADIVVAPSRSMLESLLANYGPLGDARVIYNGRDEHPFAAPAAKEPFIFTAGRLWDEAKNVQALADIAVRLPWPVYVAGEHRHPSGGEASPANVRLLGKLAPDDLAGWFRRAGIYVLPARYEPFGLTALEAGLAGCALVLGDIHSLREIWGDAACYTPVDEPESLEKTIRQCIEDESLRQELSRCARDRARHFPAWQMGNSYLEIYHELVRRRPAAPEQKGHSLTCAS